MVIACNLVFRSISIDTKFDDRDQFFSKNTAAGLPKNYFAARLRHLRNTRDLRIRAFNEAHPTVWVNIF